MNFNDIKGNEPVKKALAGMVDSGKVPHAIMFHENDGGGAFPLCMAFLQYLFYGEVENSKISKLIHPDVHFVFPVIAGKLSNAFIDSFRKLALSRPRFFESELNEACGFEGKLTGIAVAEANALISELAFNSLEGGYKAVVMYLPEKMNAAAANKLLKLLEEPSGKTIFLLITHYPEKVMQTVSSRCQTIRIRPDNVQNGDFCKENREQYRELFLSLMDSLLARDLYRGIEVGEQLAALSSRDKAKDFCRYSSECFRRIFLLQKGLDSIAGVADGEGDYYRRFAEGLKNSFPCNALNIMDRAQMLIDRNINQKILFCDLVNRLFAI